MTLVDTSIWIEVFRRRNPLDLETVVPLGETVLCLPVLQEVLQGFGEPAAYRIARDALSSFPILENPMHLDLFEEAANLYRTARRNGLTIRSSIDCLIAACAIRADAEVLHRDRDFAALARVSALREREP